MPRVFVVPVFIETLALGSASGEREAVGIVVDRVSHAESSTTAKMETMWTRIIAPLLELGVNGHSRVAWPLRRNATNRLRRRQVSADDGDSGIFAGRDRLAFEDERRRAASQRVVEIADDGVPAEVRPEIRVNEQASRLRVAVRASAHEHKFVGWVAA